MDNTGTMSLSSTLTRSRSELPSNTNTLTALPRTSTGGGAGYTNQSYNTDRGEERSSGGERGAPDPDLDLYPTNGTLPIQRPSYQPVRLLRMSV